MTKSEEDIEERQMRKKFRKVIEVVKLELLKKDKKHINMIECKLLRKSSSSYRVKVTLQRFCRCKGNEE
jgi:hypothetical protein